MDNRQSEQKKPINDENDMLPLELDNNCYELSLDLEFDQKLEKKQNSNLLSEREQIPNYQTPFQPEGPEDDLIQLSIHIPTCNSTRTIKVKPKISIIELTKKVKNDLNLEENKNYSFRAYGQDFYNLDQTLEDYYVGNQSTIELKISTDGGTYDIIDFSNMKNMELIAPSKSRRVNPWRYLSSGLNLPGICQNENCKAYNLQVICPQGNGSFNIAELIYNLCCPQCKSSDVIAEGDCYFSDCIYNFKGGVIKEGEKKQTKYEKTDQKCPKGQFVHFKGTNKEDKNKWLYLTITTRKQ